MDTVAEGSELQDMGRCLHVWSIPCMYAKDVPLLHAGSIDWQEESEERTSAVEPKYCKIIKNTPNKRYTKREHSSCQFMSVPAGNGHTRLHKSRCSFQAALNPRVS